MKRLRLFAALSVATYSLLWPLLVPQPVLAELVPDVSVVCAKPDGTQQTFMVGWDNSNPFFDGKGNIAALYCEGGFAGGGFTVYVSDNLQNESLRYFNGVIPSTTISPEPSQSPSPTPSPVPSQTSTQTPTPTPSSSPSAETTPTSTPAPSSEPSPTQSPSAEPSPSPSEVAQPTSSPEPTPTVTPTPSPTQLPSPSLSIVFGIVNENGILELVAPKGTVFDSVIFASYGTPNNYELGQCHAANSAEKVAEAFLGKNSGSIPASNGVFGDPCGGTYKKLAVKLSYINEVTPTPSPTPTPTPEPTPEPSPTPTPQPQPTPTPTPEPSSSPTPLPEPVPVPEPRPSPQPEPTPVVPLPEPTPTPVPEPTPPAPEPTPTPSPEETQNPADTPTDTPPSDNPSDTPSGPENPQDTPPSSDNPPTDSSTDSNTDTEPTPTEEPSTPTSPEETGGTSDSSDVPPSEESSKPTQDNQEQQNQSEESSSEPTTTAAAVIAVLAEFKDAPVPASALAELGLTFSDLPPETPVDVRTDENGNAVIITAEVAAALELIENPSELIGALFEDPGQVLLALGSIGADMSPQEREEAQKMVVATVIAAGAAMNAVAATGGVTRKGK